MILKKMLVSIYKGCRRLQSLFCTAICLRRVKYHGEGVKVNAPCHFNSFTTIGTNCHFNGMKIFGAGNVSIGDNFHSGRNIQILTEFHNYEGGRKLPYDETTIKKDVVIADNVWIGQDVTILAGVSIGEGAVIQAGSVICKDIPPLAVAGGHPAVPFRYRDKTHYEKLKKEKMFF